MRDTVRIDTSPHGYMTIFTWPQGNVTSGVTLEGNRVTGADRRGQGRDIKSPANRDNKGISNTRCGEETESEQETAAPQSPHQGTAEGERGEVSTQRHPDSADGARPKHGTLARHEYGLLVPEE